MVIFAFLRFNMLMPIPKNVHRCKGVDIVLVMLFHPSWISSCRFRSFFISSSPPATQFAGNFFHFLCMRSKRLISITLKVSNFVCILKEPNAVSQLLLLFSSFFRCLRQNIFSLNKLYIAILEDTFWDHFCENRRCHKNAKANWKSFIIIACL